MNQNTNSDLFSVKMISSDDLSKTLITEQYLILLFEGRGVLTVDFIEFEFDGKIAFFHITFPTCSHEKLTNLGYWK